MENLPNTQSRLESNEREPVGELQAAVEQLDARATELERAGSDVDISEETAERIEKKTSRIKKLLKGASMALALFGSLSTVNYLNTRFEIETEQQEDGSFEYFHEDAETTRILNFITGKEEIAEEDKIHFYRQLVRDEYLQYESLFGSGRQDLDLQIDLENSLSNDENVLRDLLRNLYLKKDAWISQDSSDVEERVDQAFKESVEVTLEYNPIMEKLVWDMQKKVGAPKLRWAAPNDSEVANIHGSFAGPGRSFYSSEENTIYLSPYAKRHEIVQVLFAENAHALQFDQRPVSSRVRYIVDTARTVLGAIGNETTIHEEQYKQYKTEGSVEYEAHEIIEKQLFDDFIEQGKKLENK